MSNQSWCLPSDLIPVLNMRTMLLWPLRVKANGHLEARRKSTSHGASSWIAEYTKHVEAGGKWRRTADHYLQSGRRNPPSDEERYGEFLYFHPFIQNCLYGKTSQSPVSVLTRTDIAEARIQLSAGGTFWRCEVERANLFLFPTDVAILMIQLNHPVDEENKQPFMLSDALDFLDWVRRVYPPFYGYSKERKEWWPGKVPHSMEWVGEDGRIWSQKGSDFGCRQHYLDFVATNRKPPVGRHWQELLRPLECASAAGTASLEYRQVEDDRLPVVASLSVDAPELISRGDWMRLGFCDDHGASTALPYASEFMKGFESEVCYDRFWTPAEGWKTRHLVTGYSFISVGKASEFFDDVLSKHVENQYSMLVMLAHLQKASLLAFWQRLAENVEEFEQAPISHKSRDRLRTNQSWLLEDLTDFVSRFYFSEVSNQLQAQELFDRVTKQLRVRDAYRDVMEQSEFVNRVLLNEWQLRTTKLANIWLPLGFAASVLGINIGVQTWGDGLVGWYGVKLGLPEPWVGIVTGISIFLLAWGFVWFIYWLLVKRRHP